MVTSDSRSKNLRFDDADIVHDIVAGAGFRANILQDEHSDERGVLSIILSESDQAYDAAEYKQGSFVSSGRDNGSSVGLCRWIEVIISANL